MENAVTGVPERRERLVPKSNVTSLNSLSGEYEWVIYVVFIQLATFSIIGSVGNAIVVYIYSNKKEKATSNIFIISLAIVDLLTCLVIIPFTTAMEFIDYRIVYDGLCKIYFFLITFNVPFSMFIMVAIAFDRYFCICHPFLGVMTVKRAKVLICVLGLSATSLGLFTSLMHGMYDFNSAFNETAVDDFSLDGFNESSTLTYSLRIKTKSEYSYTGICGPNVIIISKSIRKAYQKFYSLLFLVSFIIIAVLYALIVRFVVLKRSWRQKAKYTNPSSTGTTQDTVIDDHHANNDSSVAVVKTSKKDTMKNGKEGGVSKRTQRKHDKTKEKNQSSNLKIAGMLFVVTLVFVIAFLPGWLIAHQVLPANRLIFYMYFLYNVANPAIYAFMNPVFRKDMKRIFKCT